MSAPARVDVAVLGAVEVRRDGTPLDLGAPKQRALVSALALAHGWPVSVDGIVDHLWGDDPPPGVTGTLQAYVSQLRRVIEPDRPPRAPATVLVTAAPGYALKVGDDNVDAHRFEQTVARSHKLLQRVPAWGPHDVAGDRLAAERAALDEALATWRGTPYADLGDAAPAVAERTRLEGLRMVALEDRAVAALAMGDHATVAAELEALTAAHPLRERLWALRAVALARSGRQADALDALRQVREILDGELGIELSAELRDLQTAVLRQDERLDWVAPPTPGSPTAAPTPTTAAATAQSDSGGSADPGPKVAPWPMIGRDAELAGLTAELDQARSGTTSFAVITGEPGIGKSRLSAELIVQARRRGVRVLAGRCSQDEGAPPLWPWRSVLEGLGVDLMRLVSDGAEVSESDEGSRFRAWERISAAVREAARQEPLVVLLDDLHWADEPTLRVLRLLLEAAEERLLLLATWRLHPPPAGALADVAEAFARRHALRLDLHGLAARDVRAVFEAVTGRSTGHDDTGVLLERTDGNPFFVVEVARLAADRSGGVDLAGGELPRAVGEVIDRRLARLPDATLTALRTAAVIGRRFDLSTLALAARLDEDDALDVVEPAQAAGLLRENGVDHYLFTHALVRDRLRDGGGPSRLARIHARVAAALARVPGRESEVARHWRDAGPAHAGRAWRSAVDAADVARRLHDHEQAAALLRGALESMTADPEATGEQRYDLLMALIEAYRWAALLPQLVGAAEEAIEVAKALRDPAAVARAAISASVGVLWRSAPPGQVNDTVVAALRGSLERLPDEDGELRCRVLMALANELGISVPVAEKRALVDEGLAMARRLGDPVILVDALQLAFVTLWVPSTAVDRLGWVTEAMDLARSARSERRFVVGATLRAVVLSELGRLDEMREAVVLAREAAQRLRIAFGEMVLDALEVPWFAMAGRFDECDRLLDSIREVGSRIAHTDAGESVVSSLMAIRLWQGRSIEMVPILLEFDDSPYPFAPSIAVYLARAGELDRARAYFEEHGAPLDHDYDVSLFAWCHAGELALHLDEPALGRDSYQRLVPYAGRSCCAGSALAMGPVDAYLAMAAAAAGDARSAAAHADDALALVRAWQLPLFETWFLGQRATYGF